MNLGASAMWCAVTAICAVTVAASMAALRSGVREQTQGTRRTHLLAGAAAFCIVCSGSLFAIDRWAFSHPFWDQWVEGKGLYEHFVRGTYTWQRLFEPHNEHRIALTRLWALVIFLFDRQWDNRTGAVANSFVHALPAGLIVVLVAQRFRTLAALAIAATLIIPWSLPLSRDGMLLAFNSQFYFLLLYVPIALWLLTHSKPWTARYWLGTLCGLLALFSVGSGPVAAIALLAALALESLCNRSSLRNHMPVAAVALSLAVVGVCTRVFVPYLVAARAHTTWQFLSLTLRCWSYPFTSSYIMGVILWAPSAVGLVTLVRARDRWTDDARFLVALGIFVFLHAPMIGWARANDSPDPSNRYFDIFTMGLFVNAIALIAIMRGRAMSWARPAIAAWFCVAAIGTFLRLKRTYHEELPYFSAAWTQQQLHVRRYLETHDPKQLVAPVPWEIPHWSAEELAHLLDDPFIRSILPASVRLPLATEIIGPDRSVFSSPGLPPEHSKPWPPLSIADWRKHQTGHTVPTVQLRIEASQFARLRIGVTGTAQPMARTLALLAGGVRRQVKTPIRLPSTEWSYVGVKAPQGPFTIEATSTDWNAWWGFTAPVEVGTLSAAIGYMKIGKYILLIGGLLLLLVAAAGGWPKRPTLTRDTTKQ